MTHPDIEALRALLARVEGSTGADEAIDEAIYFALLSNDPWGKAILAGRTLVASGQSGAEVNMPGVRDRMTAWSWAKCAKVPAYTFSLDAVVALVERVLPGWSFLWAWNGQRSIANVHIAPLGTDQRWASAGQAPTPALALCAALLRALIARTEAGEQT